MTTPTLTLNNGLQMPAIGLGTWKSPQNEVAAAVKHALLESHYTHIDCAKVYENEKEIGTAFAEVFAAGTVRREDIFITSKLWNTDHDPAQVEAVCRQTLEDLQLEYLDLYLMHWGVAFAGGKGKEPKNADGTMELALFSIQDTWRAMENLVEKGLVKSIGVANFSAMMLVDLLSYAKVPPAMNQIELHPYNAQQALVDYCHTRNVAVTAYSPLGNKTRVKPGDPVLLDDEAVLSIAKEVGKSPAQVLLRWAVQRKTVVIPKSVTPSRISENIAVFDFELSEDHMSRLSALNHGQRLVDPSEWWGVPYFT
ncbi:aldo/keto reductase [Candidatus Woesebacteria bacterium]|nr:aldo/keto reductase [Candidatus Woesebacteria bacterium]